MLTARKQPVSSSRWFSLFFLSLHDGYHIKRYVMKIRMSRGGEENEGRGRMMLLVLRTETRNRG